MTKVINSIYVDGTRWNDKVNANTYNSAKILVYFTDVDTPKTLIVPFGYGYENMYIDRARELLITAGLIPPNTRHLFRYCFENHINLDTQVRDGLKRDMHKITDI